MNLIDLMLMVECQLLTRLHVTTMKHSTRSHYKNSGKGRIAGTLCITFHLLNQSAIRPLSHFLVHPDFRKLQSLLDLLILGLNLLSGRQRSDGLLIIPHGMERQPFSENALYVRGFQAICFRSIFQRFVVVSEFQK